jgi:peptide/nickel transport system permease protein
MPHPLLLVPWTSLLAVHLAWLAAAAPALIAVTVWLGGRLSERRIPAAAALVAPAIWLVLRVEAPSWLAALGVPAETVAFAWTAELWVLAVAALTAIILPIPLAAPTVPGPAPARRPAALAGLVLPGLGHLLTGDVIPGAGMLALDAAIGWAWIAGLPRYADVLFPDRTWMSPHALIALDAALGGAAALWFAAWRHAFPRPVDEETRNSNARVFARHFRGSRSGMIGLFGALILVALVLVTPLIAPYDPDRIFMGKNELAPCAEFWLGTDHIGRDLLSRLLYGGRISLSIGFIAVGIAATIGVIIGAIAGYAGGWVDRAIMWFVDLLLSVPSLVLLLALVGLFRTSGAQSLFLIVTILGLTGWMGVTRLVRAQVLSIKQQDFIEAARALGFSTPRIVLRHLIPNAMAPVIVQGSLAIGAIILAEATLSFLGLGVSPPTSTWGTIANDGRQALQDAPWIATFPGLCIVAAVMSFNLLGDGLRDALDPKLRGR